MKPILCLRLENHNIVSLGALLGSCADFLLDEFEVRIWRTDQPIPMHPGESGVFLFSFMMPHVMKVRKTVETLRDQARTIGFGATTWAGGAQASVLPQETSEIGFDTVFCGEGENEFPRHLQKWLAGEPIDGIVKISPGQVQLDDFPGFHPIVDYLPPIEITRGCSFGCSFCAVPSLYHGKIRHRSISSILGIVKEYYRTKPGRRQIKFLAPNSFAYGSEDGRKPNIGALRSLLQGLKDVGVEKINFGSFPGEVRPDFVTREVMETVAPFVSNKRIVMGIQSPSDDVLKRIGRGHSISRVETAIELLREFGFTPYVDFIIGFPDETEGNQIDLLDFMEKLVKDHRVKIHMHTFTPLPGAQWQNKRAAPISDSARKRIKALESQGVLDGWWENQIAYSRDG